MTLIDLETGLPNSNITFDNDFSRFTIHALKIGTLVIPTVFGIVSSLFDICSEKCHLSNDTILIGFTAILVSSIYCGSSIACLKLEEPRMKNLIGCGKFNTLVSLIYAVGNISYFSIFMWKCEGRF